MSVKAKKHLGQHFLKDENIAKKIVSINKTLKRYEDAVSENNKQIIQLSDNYQSDLTRFKELTK